jgi:hypothetical protein
MANAAPATSTARLKAWSLQRACTCELARRASTRHHAHARASVAGPHSSLVIISKQLSQVTWLRAYVSLGGTALTARQAGAYRLTQQRALALYRHWHPNTHCFPSALLARQTLELWSGAELHTAPPQRTIDREAPTSSQACQRARPRAALGCRAVAQSRRRGVMRQRLALMQAQRTKSVVVEPLSHHHHWQQHHLRRLDFGCSW